MPRAFKVVSAARTPKKRAPRDPNSREARLPEPAGF
jgi:hypothetical protein